MLGHTGEVKPIQTIGRPSPPPPAVVCLAGCAVRHSYLWFHELSEASSKQTWRSDPPQTLASTRLRRPEGASQPAPALLLLLPPLPARLPCVQEALGAFPRFQDTEASLALAEPRALANEREGQRARGRRPVTHTSSSPIQRLSRGERAWFSEACGRGLGLEAEPQRGKALQIFIWAAGAGWGGRGELNPEVFKREYSPPLNWHYLSPVLEAGLSPSATMKRPCEETTSESDLDETIDVGSENNYSG